MYCGALTVTYPTKVYIPSAKKWWSIVGSAEQVPEADWDLGTPANPGARFLHLLAKIIDLWGSDALQHPQRSAFKGSPLPVCPTKSKADFINTKVGLKIGYPKSPPKSPMDPYGLSYISPGQACHKLGAPDGDKTIILQRYILRMRRLCCSHWCLSFRAMSDITRVTRWSR